MVLFGPVANATDIIVVTDSHHPIESPDGVRVIELDAAQRIEAELAANLPNDPVRSTAMVQRRLKEGGTALQQRLGNAYQGIVDAWSLGITTIPAVVVGQRYVVYGEQDIAKALARVAEYREARP
ncbi:FIG01211007: hypothetical protein [plant metagenome]|uniref:TIGR03757 family integrating conjugative element protein n=1 Tax=plant metagenome TaxID=1297885 RepID=A0A484T3K1_9ZZZZ